MGAKRQRFAKRRKALGYSQEQLAERAGVDRSTVGRWETGQTEPQPWLRPKLARVLQVSLDQLDVLIAEGSCPAAADAAGILCATPALHLPTPVDLGDRDGDLWLLTEAPLTVDEMKRRSALKLVALPLAEAATSRVEPWARLHYVLQQPGRIDEATVTHLEYCTADLFRREEHTPSRDLVADLRGHLDRLLHLLPAAPEAMRLRLLSTTGETMALAAWAAWDSKSPALAHKLSERALTAATEAGDRPLRACTLTYLSYMAEGDGDLASAQRLLDRAQEPLHSEASATTRSWVAARHAEVTAALADETDALRSLDHALVAYETARPHLERPWTAFFTPSRLGSMAVAAYARLDHPALDHTADSVVRALPRAEVKTKGVVLADVATAAIQRGQYDRGADFARQAVGLTTTQEVSIGAQRLRALHDMIRGQRHIAVLADLDDLLLAQVA